MNNIHGIHCSVELVLFKMHYNHDDVQCNVIQFKNNL